MLRRTCAFVSIAFALCLYAATAAATTAKRTFVASTGNDANPCSITAPCRNFARAIMQTSTGGEVIVLDSAGYGVVTITKSVSIIAPAGVYAGVSVFTGNGITINGPSIQVTLRGLTINGQGGATGIFFQQGYELNVEDCTISDMGDNGIHVRVAGSITYTSDSFIKSAVHSGIYSDGINGGPVTLVVHRTRLEGSQFGLYARQGAQATVSDSVVAKNGIGIYVNLDNPGATGEGEVLIDASTFSLNAIGISVQNALSTMFHLSPHAAASRTTFAQNAVTAAISAPGGGSAGIRLSSVELGENAAVLLADGSEMDLMSSTARFLTANCLGGALLISDGKNQIRGLNGTCGAPILNPGT